MGPRLPRWDDLLPKAVFVPDVPGANSNGPAVRDIAVNNDLHMYGIILVPNINRLQESLDGAIRCSIS
jgi:hypothetical protein